MKYALAKSPEFKPVPLVKSSKYNPRVFSLGTLNTPQCLQLINRMKTGAPELYNTIHNDPFVKSLVMNFNADILIPMKKRPEK